MCYEWNALNIIVHLKFHCQNRTGHLLSTYFHSCIRVPDGTTTRVNLNGAMFLSIKACTTCHVTWWDTGWPLPLESTLSSVGGWRERLEERGERLWLCGWEFKWGCVSVCVRMWVCLPVNVGWVSEWEEALSNGECGIWEAFILFTFIAPDTHKHIYRKKTQFLNALFTLRQSFWKTTFLFSSTSKCLTS